MPFPCKALWLNDTRNEGGTGLSQETDQQSQQQSGNKGFGEAETRESKISTTHEAISAPNNSLTRQQLTRNPGVQSVSHRRFGEQNKTEQFWSTNRIHDGPCGENPTETLLVMGQVCPLRGQITSSGAQSAQESPDKTWRVRQTFVLSTKRPSSRGPDAQSSKRLS